MEIIKYNKIKVYEDINSVSSSIQTSTYSRGISTIGRKIKKDNIIKHLNLKIYFLKVEI